MKKSKLLLIFIFVFMCIMFYPLSGEEELLDNGYPKPYSNYVNDYASVMDKTDAELIIQKFAELRKKEGIEGVVVTVKSFKDYRTPDKTIEEFATNLFNTWGVGDGKKNNGFMILFAKGDRKCRIELGKGYGRIYDAKMKQILDEKMIPLFQRVLYSRGIYEGSMAVPEELSRNPSTGEKLSFYKWQIIFIIIAVLLLAAGISCFISGKKGWGWVFFAVLGALLMFVLGMLAKIAASGPSGGGKSFGGGVSFGGGSSFGGGATGSW
ncbi:MAG: TPM domain-containing protein [Armatimonadota bacterium]